MYQKKLPKHTPFLVGFFILLIHFAQITQAQNTKNTIAQNNLPAPIGQTDSQRLQTTSHALINSSMTTQPTSSTGQILIFVSSSMPPGSLQQWLVQAQKIHAPVLMRGLINNSLADTKKWVTQLIQGTSHQGGIQINPVAFERYGIQQVPAVVATTGASRCSAGNACPTPPFDVVYGNVHLSGALARLAADGDAATNVARQALQQLSETHH